MLHEDAHDPMKRIWGVVAALMAVSVAMAVGVTVLADDDDRGGRSFRARLTGFEETPSTVSSPGSGTFRLRFDSRADSASYTLTYAGLSNAFAAHIHLGARGTTGGVIAFLCGGGGKPMCPTSAGSVSGTIVPADIIGPAGQGLAPGEWDEFVAAVRAGVTYANVHTNAGGDPPAPPGPGNFPGGEIRGQISTRGD